MIQNTENQLILEKVEQKWKYISEEGKKSRGISPNVDPDTPPEWFDRDKFDKSQRLGQKYYGRYCKLILIFQSI